MGSCATKKQEQFTLNMLLKATNIPALSVKLSTNDGDKVAIVKSKNHLDKEYRVYNLDSM